MNPFANINSLWAHVLVDELARCGLREAVITPGSRSTPLVLAFAEHPDIRDFSLVDERSAAFFALGLAHANGRPAALVCTSGTAAANYFPAVCEADRSDTPILVLTADRPEVLRDAGASQAMDQLKLFGDRVRWFHEVAQPEADDEKLRYLRNTAGKAMVSAEGIQPGPVHLNLPFRKPLEPTQVEDGHRDGMRSLDRMAKGVRGLPDGQPFNALSSSRVVADTESVRAAARMIARSRRPLIVAGYTHSNAYREPLAELSQKALIPAWVEAGSQLRFWRDRPQAWVSADALLSSSYADEVRPDLLITTGRWPIGWPLRNYLEALDVPRVHLATHEQPSHWMDPHHQGATVLFGDLAENLSALGDEVYRRKENRFYSWHVESAAELNRSAETADVFDGAVVSMVVEKAEPGSNLVVSSSMPLRELEAFGARRDELTVISNRGLNGIDGVLSTALGVAATGPTTLIIGDVAFAHDIGALAAFLRNPAEFDLKIVVVNNGGGAIFEFLPVTEFAPEVYDRHFRTRVDVDLESVAAAYHLHFERPEDLASLETALEREGPYLIEVQTDAALSRERHRAWLGRDLGLEPLPEPDEQPDPAAERVVLLHGFTGSPSDFDELGELIPEFEALSLLGHAGGRVPQDVEDYRFDAYFDDIERQLDELNIHRAHLVGYSMGGRLAIGFALSRPDRVASLATIGANAGITDEWDRSERRAKDEDLARGIIEDGLSEFVERWMQHPILAPTIARRGADWIRRSHNARLQGTARGYANALRGAGQGSQPVYWQALEALEAPALFIAGRQDPKYAAIARSLAKVVPDGRAEVIESAGHATHFDDPQSVAAALNAFWKEIS